MFLRHVVRKLNNGEDIASRVPATLEHHQAWIGVRPLSRGLFERPHGTEARLSQEQGGPEALEKLRRHPEEHIYVVRTFELHEDYIEYEWDVVEADLAKFQEFVEPDLNSLYERIRKLGGQTEQFVGARVCDYPL